MKRLRLSMRGWLAGWVLGTALLAPSAGRADFDLNGGWFAEAIVFGFPIECNFSVTQIGSSFAAGGSCSFVGSFSVSGTIDPVTGVFTTTGNASVFCVGPGSLTLDGAASDNSNFTGTFSCAGFGGPVVGSRCGNASLDPGEECDVGNNGNPEACCLEGCILAPIGTQCRQGFICVADGFCDGVNALCPFDPTELDGAPCDNGNPCMTDMTCSFASCTNGTPEPLGTTCFPPFDPCFDFECDGAGGCTVFDNANPCDDLDACTTNDTCSGGACFGGPPLECSGCETCDFVFGCLATMEPICQGPVQDGSSLAIRQGGSPENGRLNWRWIRGSQVDVLDFGDPRTGTNYTFCVYDDDAQSPTGLRLLADASLPGLNPNWSPKSRGWRYGDPSAGTNGVQMIVLRSGAAGESKVFFKAKGANLSMASLPANPPITVQLKADNGSCWQAEYTAMSVNTNEKLRARGGL